MIGREPQQARARNLAMMDPYGQNAARIQRESVIGLHFRLSLQPDALALGISPDAADNWAHMVEREWEGYAEGLGFDSDAGRKNTFTQQMATVATSLIVNGEAFGVMQWKPGMLGYKTCLHLIDTERVSTPWDYLYDPTVRYGVKIDDHLAPTGYFIRKANPSDAIFGSKLAMNAYKWEFVERHTEWGRPQVMHVFDNTRPDQTRGMSPFTAVARQLKMLGDWSEAALEKQLIGASFAAVIESELDTDKAFEVIGAQTPEKYNDSIRQLIGGRMATAAEFHNGMGGIKFNGSRVPHMVPGEKLHMVNSQSAGADYASFEKAMLKQLAAGLGVPYESLSRDFSDSSYSAARLSLNDIWRTFFIARRLITKKIAMPFVAAWLEEAITSGRLPMPNGSVGTLEDFVSKRHMIVRGAFLSHGKPVIDPGKEVDGISKMLALGLTTLEEETANLGRDWSETLHQRQREKDLREELGLNVLGPGLDPTLIVGQPPTPQPQDAPSSAEKSGAGAA